MSGKIAALGLFFMLACLAGFSALAQEAVPQKNHAECVQAGDPSDILEIEEGWWEDKRLIYNGIPARVLVLLGKKRSLQAGVMAEKIWCEFGRIGLLLNAYNPSSELAELNEQSKSGQQRISFDLAQNLRYAKEIHRLSGGAFDPTLWPLKRLWQEAAKRARVPEEAEIKAALAHTGLDKVQVAARGRTEALFLDPQLQLDLGGIAKGYAVDRVLELIRQLGGKAALVQLGGEVAVFGARGEEEAWKIGVQHPQKEDALWGVIESRSELRVSSSGSYRQSQEIAGKLYSHIFDPLSGQPLTEKVLGVTLLAVGSRLSSAELDAASTAVMVLGQEKGLNLAVQLGVEALLITAEDGKLQEHKTPNFDNFFKAAALPPESEGR